MMYKIEEILDLSKTLAYEHFADKTYAWEALVGIGEFIMELGKSLNPDEFTEVKTGVWIANDAIVAETASIAAPCIIDSGAEIRHSAFIRGKAIVGKGAVVGNSTELKNSILFDRAQVPHFNYVGDSILGYKSHMGAGCICSNVKSDKTLIVVRDGIETYETGLKKYSVILGDEVEVGCNSVLNPGTVVGKNASIYPLSSVRGVVKANSIYKNQNEIIEKV